jgi:hypothetical protein
MPVNFPSGTLQLLERILISLCLMDVKSENGKAAFLNSRN